MFIRKHFQTPQKALIKCCLNWGCSYLDVDPWQRKFFHSLRYCVGKDETGKENNMTLLWQPNHGKRVHLHFYSNNEVNQFIFRRWRSKWFQEFAFFRRITRKYPSWKSGMKQMEKQLKMFHCKNGTMNHSNYSIFFSHEFFSGD